MTRNSKPSQPSQNERVVKVAKPLISNCLRGFARVERVFHMYMCVRAHVCGRWKSPLNPLTLSHRLKVAVFSRVCELSGFVSPFSNPLRPSQAGGS